MTQQPEPPADLSARLRQLEQDRLTAKAKMNWQAQWHARNERDTLLIENLPTIIRLLEAVDGAEKALESIPQKVLNNAMLCHELAVKLAANGEHAMAEMQRIRAEQSAGLAEAIKRETDAALATLRAAREVKS